MKKLPAIMSLLVGLGWLQAQADTVWNPAANFPDVAGLWSNATNWTGGAVPDSSTKVVFNVPDAIPCIVDNNAEAMHLVAGDGGPGGTIIITNSANLTAGFAGDWTGIGYDSNSVVIVDGGGSLYCMSHLWVGLNPGSDGTLIINDGSVTVDEMTGLGWGGGGAKGTVHVNGGTLNCNQWDDIGSIKGSSVLDISEGTMLINGNHLSSINHFISTTNITAYGGTGTVIADFNVRSPGQTVITATNVYTPPPPPPPPAQVVWNPAANSLDTNGLWNTGANWTGLVAPASVTKVVFNVFGAIPCVVTDAAFAKNIVAGDGGPGGILIVTNGGSLTVSADEWSAIGYNNTSELIVENGGSASFGNHLWVGFEPAANGTFIMNGGTVSVAGMFGLGWEGGTGTAHINGGTLNLSQWSADPGSIQGASTLDVAGTGTIVIMGDYTESVSNYVSSGKITANGGTNVLYSYDLGTDKTIISATLPPPPQQSVTDVTVSGGNVTLMYQTTAGHTYHIESSPSLSPASWTPVAGSTNLATEASATFTFPVGSGQMFYRTVSP
ncbi:MAG: hypothetical protein WDM76_04935 [Limisphaerales bacterium]